MTNRSPHSTRRQTTVLTYLAPALVAHAGLFALLATFGGGNRLFLWWLSMSLISLPLMGWDKFAARQSLPRIPEAVFYSLCLLGGFAGVCLGMVLFRHKTLKPGFWAIVVLAASLHLGLWYLLARRVNPG
ncbi:MAG: hypothetical protein BWY10_01696 [Chloroflexi bacterium ADurb.Bin180]|nr:MAG: hypothetical protein BWY10_01696 [Chloroflexi bacterium ADurb.Bin180]HNR97675.1 DUF1294 domain-containing protein [Anaerolineae bacterium]